MRMLKILTALMVVTRVLTVVAVLVTVYSGVQLFRGVSGLEQLEQGRPAGVELAYSGILPVNLTYDISVDVMGEKVSLRRTLYVRPGEKAVIQVEPEELVVTAFKKAEDGDRLVLRFYNISGSRVVGTVRLGFEVERAWRARLDEHPVKEIGRGRSLKVEVGPHGVCTLLLEPASVRARGGV